MSSRKVKLLNKVDHWPSGIRTAIRRRYGNRCALSWCRESSNLTIHHIVPRSEGGKADLDNLLPLCRHHHDGIEGEGLRSARAIESFWMCRERTDPPDDLRNYPILNHFHEWVYGGARFMYWLNGVQQPEYLERGTNVEEFRRANPKEFKRLVRIWVADVMAAHLPGGIPGEFEPVGPSVAHKRASVGQKRTYIHYRGVVEELAS